MPRRVKGAASDADATVKGTIERFAYEGGMPYVRIPRRVGARFPGEGGPARLVATLGEVSFPCGLMPLGDGDFYVLVTSKVRRAAGVEVGSAVSLRLRPDTSRYGLPMPEELEEVLRQDPDAAAAFEALTPGRRRGVIALVSRPKGVDARIDRALAVAEALKEGVTDLRALARARPAVGRGPWLD